MRGRVDASGRALLAVSLRGTVASNAVDIDAWIDTGFTGELTLPLELISALQLTASGSVSAILADGSHVTLETYTCYLRWFGADIAIEVIANNGDHPLIGVGLLLKRRLTIDYQRCSVSLTSGRARGGLRGL
jgi:clan AA aspartic protease